MSLDNALRKINERGWNVYQTKGDEGIFDYVPRGPTRSLSSGYWYSVIPEVKEPADIAKVISVLQEMVKDGKGPVVNCDGLRFPVYSFRIDGDKITIFTPEEEQNLELPTALFEVSMNFLNYNTITCSVH